MPRLEWNRSDLPRRQYIGRVKSELVHATKVTAVCLAILVFFVGGTALVGLWVWAATAFVMALVVLLEPDFSRRTRSRK